jgi:hypothetical protein
LALPFCVLAGCAGKKESEDGPVTIELWYGAAVTEAGPPPADWKVFQLIKDKPGINLVAAERLP